MASMLQGPPNFNISGPAGLSSPLAEKLQEKSENAAAADSVQLEQSRIEPSLEQKLFFWDNIIFYLASAILGLSISNIVVDFLRPEPNSVACYTSQNTTRDQAAYINNYCNDYLPFSENFTLALVIHGVALLAPDYLWKVYFSARIKFFFSHAAKLETLRERDTGQYPHKNFNVVDYMNREFHDKRDILMGYRIKLIVQFIVVLIAISVSIGLFQDFDIEFECPSLGRPQHRLFDRVTCSYPKLRYVSILRWFDYGLLAVSLFVLLYGLYWCTLRSHPELEHENTSLFCYQSCINSKYYVHKIWAKFHYKWCKPNCYIPKKLHILSNDQHFLLVSLFATDAGLGRVFKSVQIANRINHELNAHLESLDNYDSMKHPNRQADIEENVSKIFKNNKAFESIVFKLCKGISEEQRITYGDDFKTTRMTAMDIACGYHSYLFAIARCQLQVISIILDPFYKNQTEIFKCEEHHGGVKIMRLPTNLFGLPTKHKFDFMDKIEFYTGYKSRKPNKEAAKFSLVVIGPLDDERKVNTVNQIIEMHSRAKRYFREGSFMLIIRPLEVEGKDISKLFKKWKPESTDFWKEIQPLGYLRNWLHKDKDMHYVIPDCQPRLRDGYAVIQVMCGDLDCKFGLMTFRHEHCGSNEFVTTPL